MVTDTILITSDIIQIGIDVFVNSPKVLKILKCTNSVENDTKNVYFRVVVFVFYV